MKTVQLLLMILELRGKHSNGLFETVIVSIENNSKQIKHHMLCVVGKNYTLFGSQFCQSEPVFSTSNIRSVDFCDPGDDQQSSIPELPTKH